MYHGLSPIPHEEQVCGDAGDVLVVDSRVRRSAGPIQTDEIRSCVAARYSPRWLSGDYGKRNCAFVPAHIFCAFAEGVQARYAQRRSKASRS